MYLFPDAAPTWGDAYYHRLMCENSTHSSPENQCFNSKPSSEVGPFHFLRCSLFSRMLLMAAEADMPLGGLLHEAWHLFWLIISGISQRHQSPQRCQADWHTLNPKHFCKVLSMRPCLFPGSTTIKSYTGDRGPYLKPQIWACS